MRVFSALVTDPLRIGFTLRAFFASASGLRVPVTTIGFSAVDRFPNIDPGDAANRTEYNGGRPNDCSTD